MKNFIILLALLCLLSFQTKAQNTTPETHYIEVTGISEKEIVPDEIYIRINIKERYEGRDKITIESQEEQLKKSVQDLSIPLANLSLSDANANYVRVRWFDKDVIAQKEYILKVGDAFTVGKVFQKLDEMKITDADIKRISHSKIDSFRKEIRIAAIKDAKNKSDYLLAAIGEKPGKPMVIQEKVMDNAYEADLNSFRGNVYQKRYERFAGSSDYSKEEEISFRKIRLTCSIYTKFEVK